MSIKPSKLIVLLLCSVSAPAVAQSASNPSPAFASAPARVQVNFQLSLPTTRGDTLDKQKADIEEVHAALYDLANRECATLQAAFGSDCQLVSLNLGNFLQQPNFLPGAGMTATANGTFELRPKPPSKP